jgi:glycine/D-amino acid oxidase-like deaminating enzyme
MRVAIVGAGLAGLSVAWHLCQFPEMQITLFDPKGIGGGASGISTGLLHPFPGRRALRSWGSKEGMEETRSLIAISEKALGQPVSEATGIFRPAITSQQREDFLSRAKCDSEAIWQEHPIFGFGLWIPSGITLYSRLYLDGLWKACQTLGAKNEKCAISSLEELGNFDGIVLTAGFETLRFAPHLPLQVTKGETLLCRWPEKLPCSVVSQGHITPTEDPAICQIGSTYEHEFDTLDPDEKAILELLGKVAKFYPPASDFEVVEIRAGARISQPKGYRPILEKLDAKTWVFTGLGSRGLLYHAWLGKQLANHLSNTSFI